MPTNYFQELYSNQNHFKNRDSLLKGLGLEGVTDIDEIVNTLLGYPKFWMSRKESLGPLRSKLEFCKKSTIHERCVSVGLPVIPTIVPQTVDEAKTFCKDNGTVIVKPVWGNDCIGLKEYHYRPIKEAELIEELELDLPFVVNQKNDRNQAVIQKFYPLDEKESYHYSFKGWLNNDGEFTLSHSFRESWGFDPTYDSAYYDRLTRQALSNALSIEETTFETDHHIDDEIIRQTNEFCQGNIDSAFMHGDAIVSDGKVFLIDMSPVNNFRTMVSFVLEDQAKHLFFAITMPQKGNRQEQVDLVSKHGGYYAFSNRYDPKRYKYLDFLFTGSSVKEIHANREAYTRAISDG